MTPCSLCHRPATNIDWYPTFPEAYKGPRVWCGYHFATQKENRLRLGWYNDDEAIAQFQECEFIVRATENDAYHKLIAVLMRDGGHVAGYELGQPIVPGSLALYEYNNLLWLVQHDSITILGQYEIGIKRHWRLAERPKKQADRTLAAFF